MSAPRRLRFALHAYPRRRRCADGEVLLALAQDLADLDGHSVNREALGLLAGGLVERAELLASASWQRALPRAALPVAVGFAAVALGAAVMSLHSVTWPGWSWLLLLGAPACALAGLLTGRPLPVGAGALALVLLGVAQANSGAQALHLVGTVDWDTDAGATNGFSLSLLAAGIPGALLLLASVPFVREAKPRATWRATAAWVLAGAVAVRAALGLDEPSDAVGSVALGVVRVDGVGLCMVGFAALAVAALFATLLPGVRSPQRVKVAVLVALTVVPATALYCASALSTGSASVLALFALAATVATAALLRLGHTTAGPDTQPRP